MGEPLELESAGSDMAAVIAAAQEAGTPRDLDPNKPQALIVPAGATVSVPDLSAWRFRPVRKIGTYQPATVESFIAYVERFHDPEGGTTIWVSSGSRQVVAVIDDDPGGEPGYGKHRATLSLKTTPEWDHWAGQDGNMMSQVAFAEHIEEGLEEIAEPDAANVLEIAQSFHATSSATFRQSTRLASGQQQLQYDEEIQASAGQRGSLEVPTRLLLVLAPFVGEDTVKMVARFRFRVQNGNLTLGYKLDRPDKVLQDALEAIADRLREKFPQTYLGSPA